MKTITLFHIDTWEKQGTNYTKRSEAKMQVLIAQLEEAREEALKWMELTEASQRIESRSEKAP
jgi:hypothetical protein